MTPTQARMARAAADQTTRQVAEAIGVSAMTISKIERGRGNVSSATLDALEDHYAAHGVAIGPMGTVSAGPAGEEWLSVALLQIVSECGPLPTSRDLVAAHRRATAGAEV